MNSGENNVLKVRFRLPNGEEFEAEGPQSFIDQERERFLSLIGHAKITNQPVTRTPNVANVGPVPVIPTTHTELYLWEHLLKEDGETLILRKKAKLTPQETTLVLLAGARVLLKKLAYPALELARSLKACGIEEGRLDRLLAGEIQAGRILAEGVKRSRTYKLTEEGFARAFALAEKLNSTY
ncbi:MAG: hypothetical protein IJ876_00105 [Elusimicrobiaceae bacterium]|nr:hypothetical protein [Elusimicrobiaceae bacterium]